jgi:16S rRNA (uracil1498-N3)-methyltransferase
MKTPRVYINASLTVGEQIKLDKDAGKYVVRVLRRRVGDELELFNGDGYNYQATLLSCAATDTVAEIQQRHHNTAESPLSINLVQALAKGTKLDLVIQKATELGVTQITPVSSERSVLQLDKSRVERKLEHWRGIAESAASQCHRSVIPVITAPQSLSDWLQHSAQSSPCLLLHPQARQSLNDIKLELPSCSLLIGPEGGFSDDELAHASQCGVMSFRLGPRILRTETAGFTAIAILQSLYGDI